MSARSFVRFLVEIPSTKSEIRDKSKIPMPQTAPSIRNAHPTRRVLKLEFRPFGFVSDFEIRISDFLICLLCLVPLAANAAEQPAISSEAREFFEKSVRPILANHCYKCHGPKKQKGDLRLDSRAAILAGGQTGPAMTPGKPEDSELVLAISYDPSGYQMPPTGKLDDDQIAAITKWVKMGAPWPGDSKSIPKPGEEPGIDLAERAQHWSFQTVDRPEVPQTQNQPWARNPIDRFIAARLEAAGLEPAPETDRRTWLRRVSYDLIGLPPTPEEVQQFLRDDSPDAHQKVVDRLLASPAYGERWARHWLDLVRYAETAGHEFDYEIEYSAPYRDYMVRALNADVPFRQLILEHIAGDLLPSPRRHPATNSNESIVGTGFYWFGQGKHSPVDIRAEECDCMDNQIDVLGKTFLGLTIACARCHDHKFDPITTTDYYAISGFLQSSRRQHAFIDPSEPVEKIVAEIDDIQKRQSQLVANAAAKHAALTHDVLDRVLKESREPARKDPSHPLHAWAVLAEKNGTDEFQSTKNNLARQQQSLGASSESFEVIADFTPANLSQWKHTGQAFPAGTIPAGRLSTKADRVEILLPDTAHSGVYAKRLQGVLRSPTFSISKRYIHYRMHRVGGRPNPGRATKNGQVHLIVDGFQFIKNPLYGQLTINVQQEDAFRWYRQDLEKFGGANAYIEIQDEDDGYLVVDRIVSSDSPETPQEGNSLVWALLKDPQIATPAELKAGLHRLLNESLRCWKTGEWPADSHPRERAELLNPVLQAISLRELLTEEQQAEFAALHERLKGLDQSIPEPRRAVAMADGTGEDARVLIRGNHKKPGKQAPRRFLEVFWQEEPPPKYTGSGRLDLARRIANPENPLTARVLVNRLWLHHFGRGIVATPDDFGKMGQPPTHPELLDWLAAEFIKSRWSIKHMHRLMVLSSTYRMSSRLEVSAEKPSQPDPERVDPGNRLWHRMPVQRLEGEIIRDAILAISGRLDRRMEGPSVPPYLTPFMEGRGRPGRSGPLDSDGRRSLYINVRRNFLTPMFLAFDYPTPFTTMGRRSVSNVPAQALTMMNNPFVIEQAQTWANRVLAETHPDSASRIRRLYETAYTRPPTKKELAAALEFLDTQGKEYTGPDDPRTWADLCHVLMNVKEFVFVN